MPKFELKRGQLAKYSVALLEDMVSAIASHRDCDAPEYKWVALSDGKIPVNAIVGGRRHGYNSREYNERYYIGRAAIGTNVIPGMISQIVAAGIIGHRCLFVLVDDVRGVKVRESGVKVRQVGDVLCATSTTPALSWVAVKSGGDMPSGAVSGGTQDGKPMYIGRSNDYWSGHFVGKVTVSDGRLHAVDLGKPINFTNYDVLVQGAPGGAGGQEVHVFPGKSMLSFDCDSDELDSPTDGRRRRDGRKRFR